MPRELLPCPFTGIPSKEEREGEQEQEQELGPQIAYKLLPPPPPVRPRREEGLDSEASFFSFFVFLRTQPTRQASRMYKYVQLKIH
jgi:hypothetical protein